jgi:SAM-dependent methyltransferase
MITIVEDREAQARSFGPVAGRYERGRPPYPLAAVDWLLPQGAGRVLDLGAGTGKLTRELVNLGLDVTAVDPSEGMLTELRRILPGVRALAGRAEEIPLPDDSVDAVLVAQAWHWFDPARAVPEAARVLRPGGRLGLLWNLRDEQTDWTRRLGEILQSPGQHRDLDPGPPFAPAEIREFGWTHRISRDQLLDLVASRSYVSLRPPDERAAVLAQVRQLMATHPALVGRTLYEVPYITQCSRSTLPAAS